MALAGPCTLPVQAEVVSLDQGGITFKVPDDVSPLSPEEIRQGNSQDLQFVMANPERSLVVAYDLKPKNIPSQFFNMAHKKMAEKFEENEENLKWLNRSIVDMEGQPWGYLEYEAKTRDIAYFTMTLFTRYKGQLFIIHLRSLGENPSTNKEAMAGIFNSITLR